LFKKKKIQSLEVDPIYINNVRIVQHRSFYQQSTWWPIHRIQA